MTCCFDKRKKQQKSICYSPPITSLHINELAHFYLYFYWNFFHFRFLFYSFHLPQDITNVENSGQKIPRTMNVRSIYFWTLFCWYSHWCCYRVHIFQSQKHYGREWLSNVQINDIEWIIIKTIQVSRIILILFNQFFIFCFMKISF